MRLSDNIRSFRKECSMTQEQLAGADMAYILNNLCVIAIVLLCGAYI